MGKHDEYFNHHLADTENKLDIGFQLFRDFVDCKLESQGEKIISSKQSLALTSIFLNFIDILPNQTLYLKVGNGCVLSKDFGYSAVLIRDLLKKLRTSKVLKCNKGSYYKKRATEIRLLPEAEAILAPFRGLQKYIQDNSPCVELRHTKKEYLKFNEFIRTSKMIEFIPCELAQEREHSLREIRSFLRSQKLTIDYSHSRAPTRIYNTNKIGLTSIFNAINDSSPQTLPEYGGRFYRGFWLEMKANERKSILINGSPCVELDFKAMQANMLYMKVTGEPYKDNKKNDPYDCEGLPRWLAKAAFNMLLNTKSKQGASTALNNSLSKGEKAKLSKLDLKCSEVIKLISEKHKTLEDYLHRGYGLEIQFMDSEIMLNILNRAMADNIVALPVHDACIVRAEDKQQMERIMLEEYFKYFGFPCRYDLANRLIKAD